MITRIINNSQRLGAPPLYQQHHQNDRKAVDLHLQPDWQRALGQFVEVRRNGELVREGTVDDVMPDNSILWISTAGTHQRQMVERAEGYQVYARYQWDPPPH